MEESLPVNSILKTNEGQQSNQKMLLTVADSTVSCAASASDWELWDQRVENASTEALNSFGLGQAGASWLA